MTQMTALAQPLDLEPVGPLVAGVMALRLAGTIAPRARPGTNQLAASDGSQNCGASPVLPSIGGVLRGIVRADVGALFSRSRPMLRPHAGAVLFVVTSLSRADTLGVRDVVGACASSPLRRSGVSERVRTNVLVPVLLAESHWPHGASWAPANTALSDSLSLCRHRLSPSAPAESQRSCRAPRSSDPRPRSS